MEQAYALRIARRRSLTLRGRLGIILGTAIMTTATPVEHIRRWSDEFTDIRRDLHAHPELGFEEHRTARLVCEQLGALGDRAPRRHRPDRHRRGHSGPQRRRAGARSACAPTWTRCRCRRRTTFAHRSRYDGRMHGCGHDGHTTMLLAAARYLHETRNFDGTAYLIFQPGEEGYAGAKAMIEDGLFERFPAEQVFALHNWPGLAARADRHHARARRWRPPTASRSRSTARGGHGAHPHVAVDPVLVAGHIITAVAVDRQPQREPARHRGGQPVRDAGGQSRRDERDPGAREARRHRAHVSPDDAGHDRAAAARARRLDRRRVRRDARGQVRARLPADDQPRRRAEFAADVAESLVGRENVVRNLEPSMGAEDFSFMLQAKPGAFARLGQGGAEARLLPAQQPLRLQRRA